MVMAGVLAVISGYLLGSIPAAYLAGRLKGVKLPEKEDGRFGTALAYHSLGPPFGILVAAMDGGKGFAAISFARFLQVPEPIILLAGLAAIFGHNWSLFAGFRGGRGTMTTYGVLAALAFWELMICLALAGIVVLITRKSTLATAVLLIAMPVVLMLQDRFDFIHSSLEAELTPLLVIFPLTTAIPMFLKYSQTKQAKNVAIADTQEGCAK